MSHRLSIVLTTLLLSLAVALPALAQEASEQPTDGTSVVILKFEEFEVEQPVMDAFYRELHEAVEAHDEMYLAKGGDVTVNDLILTLGCESATVECLTQVQDFVDADRLVFGSVQQADGVYMFTIKMFDFGDGQFVRELVDETIEGDAAAVEAVLPAVIQGFMFGDVGVLNVSATGADSPEVYFDGEKMGRAPLTLEGLPLGEHVVTLRTLSGDEKTEKVVLRQGEAAELTFDFAQGTGPIAIGEIAPEEESHPYEIPGWIAVGVGTAGLVVGTLGQLELSSLEDEADQIICGNAICASAPDGRASELQSDMDTAYTMSIVGWSVAAVGLATGGYLLYEAYAGGSATESDVTTAAGADEGARVTVAPGPEGVSVGLDMRF